MSSADRIGITYRQEYVRYIDEREESRRQQPRTIVIRAPQQPDEDDWRRPLFQPQPFHPFFQPIIRPLGPFGPAPPRRPPFGPDAPLFDPIIPRRRIGDHPSTRFTYF